MQNNATPTSFRDVVSLWPTMRQMAEDLDVPLERVKKWRQRNRIPPLYWEPIIDAAYRYGADLTIPRMHRMEVLRHAPEERDDAA